MTKAKNIPACALYIKKHRCLLLTLLLAAFGGYAAAQNTTPVNQSFKKDTIAINKLLKEAYEVRETQTDSSKTLYTRALNASTNEGYNNGKGEALSGIARYYNLKNEERTAVSYLTEAFKYFENNEKGKELTVSANLLLSEAYFYLGAYDSCSFYRYEALNYIEHNEIRNARLRLSVYSKILQFWLNAHEDIKNDRSIQQIMEHISTMERQAMETGDSSLLVNIYFQKEGYYHNLAQNDSARYYGLKNIELGRRLKVAPSMIMAAYLNIALTYIDDKQPDLAMENIHKAVAAAPEQGRLSNRYLIFADIFLGEVYNLLGQYKKAVTLVLPAFEAAKKLHIISIYEHTYKVLADAYDGLGDYKNAALQRKLYSIARDSLMKVEKMEMSYNLEMKYRVAEKNKELAQKELSIIKNETRIKNKNILIGSITAGLLLILLISFLILRNNRQKQKLQAEKIFTLQQEMEIKTLKAMVSGSEKERSRIARDLHDGISGTIGAIRAQVGRVYRNYTRQDMSKDFEEIMQLLEDATAEIRKTAHNLMPEILLQEGLVVATRLFCERIAKGHAIDIHFSSNGETTRIPADLELSLYRTIQELVNNVLKHAAASHAIVQVSFNGTVVGITVEDDGKGMAKEKQKEYGVGLRTITERIHALGGSISIQSEVQQGTSIYIEIDTA